MNADIKALWVDALRSGDYTQGTERLGYTDVQEFGNDVECHCCLGVLCAISPFSDTTDYSTLHLPDEVAEWAGVKAAPIFVWENPDTGISDEYDLAEVNDEGTLFDAIATIIEEGAPI